MFRAVRVVALVLVCIPATLWACAALWFDGPAQRPVAGALAAAFAVASFAVLLRWKGWRRPLAFAFLFGAVLAWWWSIPPSNERPWLPDVARLAFAEIDGDQVTIHNVRNFAYRSEEDYDERWETRQIDLSKIEGLDLFLVYWGSPAIAHTITSWTFSDGPPLAVSIETRKEVGESYSAVRGFFRQYELYYVVADELDVVGLRTNHRGEDVYLYRLSASPERARAVLNEYLEEINHLAKQARWYNAMTHNCTTSIQHNIRRVAPDSPWDWRMLVNGYIDRMAYERGSINTSLPFDELRKRSYVNERAQAAGLGADFPEQIRRGLPPRVSRR